MVLFVKKCVNIQYRKIISMTILNEHVQYEEPKAKFKKKKKMLDFHLSLNLWKRLMYAKTLWFVTPSNLSLKQIQSILEFATYISSANNLLFHFWNEIYKELLEIRFTFNQTKCRYTLSIFSVIKKWNNP